MGFRVSVPPVILGRRAGKKAVETAVQVMKKRRTMPNVSIPLSKRKIRVSEVTGKKKKITVIHGPGMLGAIKRRVIQGRKK